MSDELPTKLILKLLSVLLYCSSLFFSCKVDNTYRDKDKQDRYQNQFKAAYEHYNALEDSLKVKALNFLLRNLKDQYHFKGDLLTEYERSIQMDSNRTVSNLISKYDSLYKIFGNDSKKVADASVLTSSYLIKNIDEAFESWKCRWDRQIGFDDFCEYILPYKLENEAPENWRDTLRKEFKWVISSSQNNQVKAAGVINDKLHWFVISLSFNYPVDIGYNLSQLVAAGTCATATRMVTYPMRAIGLPVVIDFTPSWGNRASGHEWNALMLNGHPYPFNAIESNIGYYKIKFVGVDRMMYKPPKIFRKMYSIQDSSLSVLNKSNELIPSNLSSKRLKDVTNEYIPVSDIKITLADNNTKNNFAFLCIFNNKTWQPVYWGKRKENEVIFKNMGRDIVYLPAIYKDSSLMPMGNPFLLKKDGTISILAPEKRKLLTVNVKKKYPDDESNNIQIGDKYELLYWEYQQWISLGKQTAKKESLDFNNAPSNALFWIRDITQGQQERIFTYSNLTTQWW